MNMFIALFSAHLISDFILQSDSDAARKSEPIIFFKHIAITALTAYILVGVWRMWYVFPVVFIVHGLIDLLKQSLNHKFEKRLFLLFSIDQLLHLISLVVIINFIGDGDDAWITSYLPYYYDALIYIAALIFITKTGGITVGLFVKPFIEQLENFEDRGFINGGKIIGYLERFLIVLFIFTGNFTAVGFLIAAKSIFRFGELVNSHNRKEAEYIIIGTFSSFSYAIVAGFILSNYFTY